MGGFGTGAGGFVGDGTKHFRRLWAPPPNEISYRGSSGIMAHWTDLAG